MNNAVFNNFAAHFHATHTSHRATADSLSSQTIAGYYRVLKAFLNWCCDDEEYCEDVKQVTVRRMKQPKIEDFLIETFTIDQVESLLAATRHNYNGHLQLRDRSMITLLWQTDIRAGELCTLRIVKTDLQRAEPSIRVFGKGKKERRIPLQGDCRKLIKQYIEDYREESIQNQIAQGREHFRSQRQRNPTDKEYGQMIQKIREQATVFVCRYHEPLTVTGVYQIIRRLGQWAGISGVRCSPHTFRHTYASNYMRNGGNI